MKIGTLLIAAALLALGTYFAVLRESRRASDLPDLSGTWASWRSQFRIRMEQGRYAIDIGSPNGFLGGRYSGLPGAGVIKVEGPLSPLCGEMKYVRESGKLEFCGEEFERISSERNESRSDHSVAKARCQPGDRAETALQGQVPAALRRPGAFAGFHCKLMLQAQRRGEGSGWQSLSFRDRARRLCFYYDTAPPGAGRPNAGVVVLDATDASRIEATAYLTTPAMLDPMETLKVNPSRGLLVAVRSVDKSRHVDLDTYDISEDCRHPRLLSRALPVSAATSAVRRMNEGDFSPDGMTYYATSLRDGTIDVIDMTVAERPQLIAEWSMPFNQRASGLALRADGNHAYLTLYGQGAAAPVSEGGAPKLTNGLAIVDVSEVQARKADPQPRVVGSIVWGDGSASHQIVPVTIKGTKYLIATDEGGSGYPNAAGWKAACDAGLPGWSMARIVDISDETRPHLVAKLQLEVNDPVHCREVLPDLTGLAGFTYGSHYCSVDDASDATAIACAYFESGIRVFDVRDPVQPREIAYFIPRSVDAASPGSMNSQPLGGGRPDHCSAQVRFDKQQRTLTTTCQDNGFLVLRFAPDVWPFPRTSRSDRAVN